MEYLKVDYSGINVINRRSQNFVTKNHIKNVDRVYQKILFYGDWRSPFSFL